MKKLAKWKSFDFGPEISVDENQSPPKKQKSLSFRVAPNENKPRNGITKPNFNYNEKIAPKTIADLAVHPKKIQEVEGWLKTATENASEKQRTQFLLVTGPTGCGKATSVQAICKSMNVTITEWVNPVDIDYEVLRGPGQVETFVNFFTEGKYCSLFSTSNVKKIFLVKDIPNVFMRNPQEFFAVLDNIFYKALHPVIFICTDSNSNEINLQRSMFPEEMQIKYAITHISFNACASTLLKKGLKRAQEVMHERPDLFRTPSVSTIDTIIASSMGDIRCSVNQLYLACLLGHEDIPTVKSKFVKGFQRKRHDQAAAIKNMVKDEALGLFHGLGRVLNPKRKVKGNTWRMNCDVQKLVDEFSIQPAKFTSFLFENYLKYFGELNDVEKSSECLSLSAVLMENWENHDTLVLALWISVLGLMIFNEHKESKWNQIKGPRKLDKISSIEGNQVVHPTDRFYYNMITKTQKYHTFHCNF